MSNSRPPTAAGYRPEWLEHARELCLTLSTIIGDLMEEDVTIVGGLVPSLLIPEEGLPPGSHPHPGTMDVDIALRLALLNEERYLTLSRRLRDAGFEADVAGSGNPTRQRWIARTAEDEPMTVEFLISPPSMESRPGTIQDLEDDFAAIIMEGMELAFEDREAIILSGRTLSGEVVRDRTVWVAGPAAFVVLKAIALRERGLLKDAFDLYYVVRHYGDNVGDVAKRLIPLLEDPIAQRALDILREDFETIDHLGPRRAARFVGEEGNEGLRADIRGQILGLVEACERDATLD